MEPTPFFPGVLLCWLSNLNYVVTVTMYIKHVKMVVRLNSFGDPPNSSKQILNAT